MTGGNVFLRNRGDIVGFAKYVFNLGTNEPTEVIHGHALQQFSKRGERLIAVHSVQIFKEFEEQDYPYAYKGFEDPPVILGDLNKIEKAFKHVIAWDSNKIVDNPRPSVTAIHSSPKSVSVQLINPIRGMLESSPTRVRFARTTGDCPSTSQHPKRRKVTNAANSRFRSVFQELKSSGRRRDDSKDRQSRSELMKVNRFEEEVDREASTFFQERYQLHDDGNFSQLPTASNSGFTPFTGRFEESVDQFEDELDAEEAQQQASESLETSPANNPGFTSFTERFEESVDQFEDELDAEEDRRQASGSLDEDEANNISQRVRSKRTEKSGPILEKCLSPAERIIRRVRERDERANIRNHRVTPIQQPFPRSILNNEDEISGDETCGIPFSVRQRAAPTTEHGRKPHENHNSLLANVLDALNSQCQIAVGASSNCLQEAIPVPHNFDRLVAMSVKKRSYRFKTRRKVDTKKISNLRTKRMEAWSKSFEDNPCDIPRKCCNAGCFFLVNPVYAVVQYRKFLIMNRADRKRALKSMYIRGARAFWFDGAYVCTRFVANGLTFSNQLQSAVKGTLKARASSSIMPCPRENAKETKKNQIIIYLRDLADRIGDCLPTKSHTNLPLMCKKQVLQRFKSYNRSMDLRDDPSPSYFYDVWKKFCSDIKTHRHHGFTVCDTCEKIRAGFEMTEDDRVEAILRKEMEAHYEFLEGERRDYERRRDLARRCPSRYLSIIVDGADQKSYGLPHFVFPTKEDKGDKLKMKIVGVLEHGAKKNYLCLLSPKSSRAVRTTLSKQYTVF